MTRIEPRISIELHGQGHGGRGQLVLGVPPEVRIPVEVTLRSGVEGARMLERARLLAPCDIDGLPSVLDLGWVGDDAYVACRVAAGRTLAERLRAPIVELDAQTWLIAIAEILDRTSRLAPPVSVHGALDLEQIVVADEGARVSIVSWAHAPGGDPSLDRRALAALGAALCPARAQQLARLIEERGPIAVALRAMLARPVEVTAPSRAVRPPIAFDAALGAALGRGDEDDDATAEREPPAPPRMVTQAVPRLTAVRVVDAPPPDPPSSEEVPVPARRPAPAFAVGALAGALTTAMVFLATRAAPVATERSATSSIPLPTSVDLAQPPRPHAEAAAPPRVVLRAPKNALPATVSLNSHTPASAYVDDKYVGETPLRSLPVTAGHHHLRIESSAGGMRLIPQEKDVTLSPGQHASYTLDLQ